MDPKPTPQSVQDSLIRLGSRTRARELARFFKTGEGEYGEGDQFLGLTVPTVRAQARRFMGLGQREVIELLKSPWHEVRLLALIVWVEQFKRGNPSRQEQIYRAYLKNAHRVNNWDLVDVSAHEITGGWTLRHPTELKRIASLLGSKSLWERRIAMLTTLAWIRAGKYEVVTDFAARLLGDPEDLMHKATGWMLREMGKRDRERLTRFLRRHGSRMPRTMLRYAIERYSPRERKAWLLKTRSPD